MIRFLKISIAVMLIMAMTACSTKPESEQSSLAEPMKPASAHDELQQGSQGAPKSLTFIVPKDSTGFYLGKRYEKIGWHGSATHEVIFEDCRIPEGNLLGSPTKGFSQHLAHTNW